MNCFAYDVHKRNTTQGSPSERAGIPIHHSLPGATNVIYLDFDGEILSDTVWSSVTLHAAPLDLEGSSATFSASEQAFISRVWSRVAEDYAPFNIDVTTERPASLTVTTIHSLITKSTDLNGIQMPAYGAGGVAYVGIFGKSYMRLRLSA